MYHIIASGDIVPLFDGGMMNRTRPLMALELPMLAITCATEHLLRLPLFSNGTASVYNQTIAVDSEVNIEVVVAIAKIVTGTAFAIHLAVLPNVNLFRIVIWHTWE